MRHILPSLIIGKCSAMLHSLSSEGGGRHNLQLGAHTVLLEVYRRHTKRTSIHEIYGCMVTNTYPKKTATHYGGSEVPTDSSYLLPH